MPTIAELQINLDSRPVDQGTMSLNSFTEASSRVTKALKEQKIAQDSLNQGGGLGNGSGNGPAGNPRAINDISQAIDTQTRRLKALEEQRKALNSSQLKSTNPEEYTRLNQIIDTNIALVNRQGNSLDRLAAQAERERRSREAAALADTRRAESQARAVAAQEAAQDRASQKQARDLEATLSGLSAQIRAQQEYNRTIEQLNLARATGGMNGGAGLSSGEYDTYVKLAAAKRDDALATRDNSAEISKVQNKLEAVTASLGRAERAEVQYARSLRTLNDGLSLGVLSVDQYNTKLEQITTRRDGAISAANNNAAAEQRFARQLQSVVGAYDPVLQAQTRYNESIRVLSQGFQSGRLTIDQFNKALTEQRSALDGVKDAQSGGGRVLADRYQQALDRLLPYNAQLRSLAESEKILQQQMSSGKVLTDQQIADYKRAEAAIAAERKEIERRTDASRKSGNSAKQDAAALRGLPAQFSDIVVSLQGGQAPLTVLLQQGAQIKDMFGGVVPALKAVGGAVLNMISPVTLAAAAVVGLGVAWNAGADEAIAFNKAAAITGNAAGVSSSQFSVLRERIDGVVGTSGKAAEALTLLERSGRIAGSSFEAVAEAAIKFERSTGQAVSQTVEDFASLGKDPVQAAVTLDEKYRFLTSSVLAQAQALVSAGKETEATKLLQDQLAVAVAKAADDVEKNTGIMERAWRGVKDAVSETVDAIKSIGRDTTAGDQLTKQQALLDRTIARLKEGNLLSAGMTDEEVNNNPAVKQIRSQIAAYQQLVDQEDVVAKAAKETSETRAAAVSAQASAQKRYENGLEGVAKAELNLQKVLQENNKIRAGVTADNPLTKAQSDLIAANEAEARKKIKEAQEKEDKKNKPKASAIDNTDVQEVRNSLNVITAEYEGYYKKVTAIGEAGLVSQEATYASQKAILEAEAKAVSASYDQQIAKIEELRKRKNNTAAQNISLDNQMSKAEAARQKALEDLSTRQEVLDTKEKGRLEERTRNITQYREALEASLQSAREQGARALDAVGRGDRQGQLNSSLADNDRTFNREQLKLAKDRNKDTVEYEAKLKDLTETHTAMRDQIIANDKAIQDANRDWTNGYSRAIENAEEAGVNFAGSVNSALSGAFESAGSALATFVTTGKLNFKDFARSIVADMATIAAKQAAMGALGSLFRIAGSAAAAYFGGPSSAGSTQAGYTSQYFPQTQAKGGAWEAGKMRFAKGGAFTNSIVSSPTQFNMANGRTGEMGEAGPEAILPLTRTRDGSLGVRALTSESNSVAGGGTLIQVNVQVAEGGSQSQSSDKNYENFGQKLGTFVRQEVYSVLNIEQRPGGSLDPSTNSR